MKLISRLIIFCLCTLLVLPAYGKKEVDLSNEVKVKAEPIFEMSGIAKSLARDDLYWVHNDSGDKARIFAINSAGLNIIPTYSKFSFYGEKAVAGKEQWEGFKVLFAENVDWEDMTIDEEGLYVADMGNNGNDREDMGIYIISEIDPTASTQSAAIKFIPVSYPDQKSFPAKKLHFDSESLFSADGHLYVITKHREKGKGFDWEDGAKLYRLDSESADENNVLTFIESHDEITAATSAEVSPNGAVLAVLSYTELWLFDKPENGDAWLSSSFKRYKLDEDDVEQTEAITWIDNETLLITNEQRKMFQIKLP